MTSNTAYIFWNNSSFWRPRCILLLFQPPFSSHTTVHSTHWSSSVDPSFHRTRSSLFFSDSSLACSSPWILTLLSSIIRLIAESVQSHPPLLRNSSRTNQPISSTIWWSFPVPFSNIITTPFESGFIICVNIYRLTRLVSYTSAGQRPASFIKPSSGVIPMHLVTPLPCSLNNFRTSWPWLLGIGQHNSAQYIATSWTSTPLIRLHTAKFNPVCTINDDTEICIPPALTYVSFSRFNNVSISCNNIPNHLVTSGFYQTSGLPIINLGVFFGSVLIQLGINSIT